jgi:hypothetical protein
MHAGSSLNIVWAVHGSENVRYYPYRVTDYFTKQSTACAFVRGKGGLLLFSVACFIAICSCTKVGVWELKSENSGENSKMEDKKPRQHSKYRIQNSFPLKPDTWIGSSGKLVNWKCTHII